MIFNKTEKQEKDYLQKVLSVLIKAIDNTTLNVKCSIDTLNEYKDYIWSNKDIDPQEIRSMRESILNHLAVGQNIISKKIRIARMLSNPYFGRFDFTEDGRDNTSSIYIGVHSFYDTSSNTIIIYDWRAPISGMFYEFEPGPSSYNTPESSVKGNISLKRQYRIKNGKMELMIDSSITLHDDILINVLSTNSDDRMKNIVNTIQREQNNIIRNNSSKNLIIQGVAGSGKTSIALHRIAYMLYTSRNSLSSKEILIISPNRVFSDYISNVLPELGEENVPETTMEILLLDILNNKYKHQSYFEHISYILENPREEYIQRTLYKSSLEFVYQLDRFILYIQNNYFHAKDLKLSKNIIIPSEFIEEQFKRFNHFPVRQRFNEIVNYLEDIIRIKFHYDINSKERSFLKKEIRMMFAGNNDIKVYKAFFEWIQKPEMAKHIGGKLLEYNDIAPLAYIRIALEGSYINNRVKHLIVDEMQDYTPIQYRILQKLYPCNKTILGDINQSINPYNLSTTDIIKKSLITGDIMCLHKSYRSTFEITTLAQKIRKDEKFESIRRHGSQPQILNFDNREKEILGIVGLITAFKHSTYSSLAIICKTDAHAKDIEVVLNAYIDNIQSISSYSSAYSKGIIVTSIHMAKGLEFDEVIIPYANNVTYFNEIDKGLLYVAITRAMHQLTITYNGEKSPLL